MRNFKLLALSILVASCSNPDSSTSTDASMKASSASESQVLEAQEPATHVQAKTDSLSNDGENGNAHMYAELPPAKPTERELSADSACKDMNKYLSIHSELVSHNDNEVVYKVTATNNAAFPIKEAGGAIEIADVKKNGYACDFVAWGFSKADGSEIEPGQNVSQEIRVDKNFRCSSDFMKNPNDGYVFHYVQGYLELADDTKLTTPTGINCTLR